MTPILSTIISQDNHWLAVDIVPPHTREISPPTWWLWVALYSSNTTLKLHYPSTYWQVRASFSDWDIERKINHGKVEWEKDDPYNIDRENIEEIDRQVARLWRLRIFL